MMYMLGRIPAAADRFDVGGWRFEVMDMDKNRVDKVLVTPCLFYTSLQPLSRKTIIPASMNSRKNNGCWVWNGNWVRAV